MISLKVVDIKKFTKNIFVDSVFDNFVTSSVEVVSFNKFTIDGKINRKWYTKEENELIIDEYTKWEELKKYVYDIIKGNRVPISFKIVLLLSNESMQKTIAKYQYQLTEKDIEGLFINIIYQNNQINIVTGISYKSFIMDKTMDTEWDNVVKLFLKKNEIEFEEA